MNTDVSSLLRSCSKPILYLAGAQDKIIGGRGLAKMRAIRDDIASVEIDAPHLLLQRRPREALAAIEKFLREEGLFNPCEAANHRAADLIRAMA